MNNSTEEAAAAAASQEILLSSTPAGSHIKHNKEINFFFLLLPCLPRSRKRLKIAFKNEGKERGGKKNETMKQKKKNHLKKGRRLWRPPKKVCWTRRRGRYLSHKSAPMAATEPRLPCRLVENEKKAATVIQLQISFISPLFIKNTTWISTTPAGIPSTYFSLAYTLLLFLYRSGVDFHPPLFPLSLSTHRVCIRKEHTGVNGYRQAEGEGQRNNYNILSRSCVAERGSNVSRSNLVFFSLLRSYSIVYLVCAVVGNLIFVFHLEKKR